MPIQTVTVTGTIGPAAANATVLFTPSKRAFQGALFTDQGGFLQPAPAAAVPATVTATCDSAGAFSAPGVTATDNSVANAGPLPGQPLPWTWNMTVTTPATGAPVGLSINQVIFTATEFRVDYANGATQNLSTLLPAAVAPGFAEALAIEIARATAAETAITTTVAGDVTSLTALINDCLALAGGTITGPVLFTNVNLLLGPTFSDTVNLHWESTNFLKTDAHFHTGGDLDVDGNGSISGGFDVGGNSILNNVAVFGLMNYTSNGVAVALATGGTIDPVAVAAANYLASTTGNVTGIILAAGTDAQVFNIVNTTAFTITFAAVGTSRVADGVSDVIPALSARQFVYDASTSKWYRMA